MADDVFDATGDGALVLRLHVQPGAGRTAVVGRHGDALKVRVAAPPEGGRANDACLALVAATFGVEEGQVELVGGPSSRAKRVKVEGVEPDHARRLLDALVEGRGERREPGGRPGGRGR